MEQATLIIRELTEGREQTKQLKAHMGEEVSGKTEGILIEGILSSYEKALWILNWGGSMEQSQQHVVPSGNVPGSPLSVIGSPQSEDLNPGFNAQQHTREFSRKRKAMLTWTEQVKVNSENGWDGPPEDGYSWRKYGQKDILGAKYPRSYYRCTYRDMQGCCANKLVQRKDEDPTVFDITYKGKHTCTLVRSSKSRQSPSEKKEQNKQQSSTAVIANQERSNATLNFPTELSNDLLNIDNQQLGLPFNGDGLGYKNHTFIPSVFDDNNFYSSFAPSFLPSPATSESNYFSRSPCKINTFGGVHYGQQSESDITEIISAATSVTNSPIIGLDFQPEQTEFNISLPFDNLAFLPDFS